jgi:hypothetical protein
MSDLIISFESANFAIQTEAYLKKLGVKLQMMPTPREITLSCGLSIKTSVDNLNKISELVDKEIIRIKGIYVLNFDGKQKSIQKVD